MTFKFNKQIYSKLALLKAAYNFTQSAYVHIDIDQNYYIVSIKNKYGKANISEKDFVNEILAQMVRNDINAKTKNIRELILARAFSSTLIDNEEKKITSNKDTDINMILKDWFELNE